MRDSAGIAPDFARLVAAPECWTETSLKVLRRVVAVKADWMIS